jgi:3',5'-cyclic AMP phosphodiesterase CpdA
MLTRDGRMLAVSDLHVGHGENRAVTAAIRPGSDDDWLVVAGDVGDTFADIEATLTLLSRRFAKVLWSPGNHELWTPRGDPLQLRGVARYERLVQMCRSIGVSTPEDPYPVWSGPGGPVTVAPLFTLYDYSFRTPTAADKTASLAQAYDAGVVCTDEFMLHPEPYESREQWCWARIAETERRLAAVDPAIPTVLINHWPLVREPTRVLHHPEFAQWCGTELTADWHIRFRAAVAVYGHLHIPRTTTYDGVRFEEVSLGYPREWKRRGAQPDPVRSVLTSAEPV